MSGAAVALQDSSVVGLHSKGSKTLSQWLQTLAWTAAVLLTCLLAAAVERYLVQVPAPYRLLRHPGNLVMRAFGYPHILVALLFMVTSRRLRDRRGRFWFVGLLAAAGALAYGVSRLGGWGNPVAQVITFVYFVVHDFRDLVWFYKSSGDSPHVTRRPDARLLIGLQVVVTSLLGAVLVPVALQYFEFKSPGADARPILDQVFPASVPVLARLATLMLPVLLLDVLLGWCLVRTYPGGWRAVWREHRTILLIAAGYAGIVLSTLLLGAETYNIIALAHFVGWYCHADRALRSRPRQVEAGCHALTWVRATTAGFRTLHLGLIGIFVVLFSVSAYGFANSGLPKDLLGPQAFAYWTILHVTVSFSPR